MIRKVLKIALLALTIAVGTVLLLTAFAGHIDPRELPIASVAAMCLPIAVIAAVVVLILDLIWARLSAVIMAGFMAISLSAIVSVFPLNFGSGDLSAEEQTRSWTLLSYNVLNFEDLTGKYPGDSNPTVNYILSTNADVVCLQEAEYLNVHQPTHFTRAQIDSLSLRYPYILTNADGLYLLSKFPATSIRLSQSTAFPESGEIAAYAIEIHGQRVAVYNVHMCSIGLSREDKAIYRDLTGLKGDSVSVAMSTFTDKIEAAAAKRASQVQALVEDIRKTGGTNVVVCGDFNDVPGCYAIHQLEDVELQDAWSQVGLGYCHTYNRNRFYFRIDHVLWRGQMQVKSMQRDKPLYSDHYPLLTTFVFDETAE